MDSSMDFNAIIFIGPQGSGMGTQAQLFAKKLGFFYWGMGAILREIATHNDELGKRVGEIIDQGKLLDDATIFAVVDKNLRLIADVSGILTFSTGEHLVSSGKQQTATGLAAPNLQGMQLATISYNGSGGYGPNAVKFSLQGMLSGSITDSTVKSGLVTEAQTASISSGTGEGTYNGIRFVVTGSWSLKGKSTN